MEEIFRNFTILENKDKLGYSVLTQPIQVEIGTMFGLCVFTTNELEAKEQVEAQLRIIRDFVTNDTDFKFPLQLWVSTSPELKDVAEPRFFNR